MVGEGIIKQFLEADKNLTTLNGKKPTISNWTKRKLSDDWIYAHKGNLGWVLGERDLVIDVDPRSDGDKGFETLKEHLSSLEPDLVLEPTVMTPGGGFHIYMTIPHEFDGNRFKRSLLKEYPGVEFITQGGKCTIPGSQTKQGEYTWADDIFGSFEQTEAPNSLVNLIAYTVEENPELGDFEGMLGDSSNWTETKISLMLKKLDPSMGHNEWLRIGMALHDWDPVNGLMFWEKWSKKGENYTKGECAKRWSSFTSGMGVSMGSMVHMVKENKFDEEADICTKFVEKMNAGTSKEVQFEIVPLIRKKRFNKINLEILAVALQNRMKHLTGVKIPIKSARVMVRKPDLIKGSFIDFEKAPDWTKRWVYVNSHAAFIEMTNFALHKSESFNIECGRFVPTSDTGTKPSASKYVSDNGFVRKVETIAYLPKTPDVICDINGRMVLNSFNKKTIPDTAESYTKSGKEAIARVKQHFKLICTTDENADILTQWIAHQLQYPGEQILWAPVIQSIEGVGKSFFGELLRGCLGDRNVGTVSPTQAVSDFNGWATNVCVNILEELKVRGHNRFDTVNALKPLITDRMIQINDKGIKQFTTYNTTNYIVFTNHKDCIPMHENDRRWWIIFVPLSDIKYFKGFTGEHQEEYFPKLFDAIRDKSSQIRKWLLEYPITEEFRNTKRAPMTDAKLSMIATEEASTEGLAELKDLIEYRPTKFYNKDVVCPVDLFDALLLENEDLAFRTTQKNILLKRMGYSKVASPMMIAGKTRNVWTKFHMSNQQIKESLMNVPTKLIPHIEEDDEDL